jgi:chromosome segregation ATPase
MYLKRLEIQGFKSFAHASVLTFEPGITAVVGPNGSGKSNVADAIRWVLGEQSKSLLRSKKAEDVIFVGSDKKARASSATVSVVFDNRDGKLPIDSAEVVFTRKLHRDGTSEYLINNQGARLLDITENLSRAGFGQSRYSVIGQGVIDQFLLQGPAEIKALIEEACGIAPFYNKREKTLRRLETTRDNLSQVMGLLAEIEPRLKTLRRQAKRLEQKAELEKEWRRLALGRFAHVFSNLRSERAQLAKQIEELENKISNLAAQVQAHFQSIETSDDKSSGRSELLTQLQAEIAREQAAKEKIQISLTEVRMKIQSVSRDSAQRNASATRVRLEEFERRENELSVQVAELETTVSQTKNDIEEIVSILNSVKPELVARFQAIIQKFVVSQEQFLSQLLGQRSELERTIAGLRAELKAADSEKPTEGLGELEQQIASELRNQETKLNDLRARVQKELQNMSSYTSERQEADRAIRGLEAELNTMRMDQSNLRIAQARIETRLEEEERKAAEDFGHAYNEFIAHAEPLTDPNLESQVTALKKQLDMVGGLDDMTLQEYQETEERFTYLSTQTQDLEKASADLDQILSELNDVIKKSFNEAYAVISEKFSEYFRMLFNGGKASLSLLKAAKNEAANDQGGEESAVSEDAEREAGALMSGKSEIIGVEVRATPPGKKLSSIAALSGGERSLTSIALLMAMLDAYPSPFVVFDEADAALDESNSIRFAKILGQLSDRTQFVTISHNRETMRRAHTLYGVTMGQDGVSQLLSIKFDQSLAYAKD